MFIKITFKVKEIRKRQGVSIRYLAEISGVSRSEISGIEAGKIMPTIYTVCYLAVALGVDARDLFDYKCPT